MKSLKNQLSTYHYQTATEERLCHGCGEIRITAGDTEMVATADGSAEERHYCLRCIFAIDCKMRNRQDHTASVAPGSLKLSMLSNVFRKRWNELCAELVLFKKTGETQYYDDAIRRFCQDMGVSTSDKLMMTPADLEREKNGTAEEQDAALKAKRHEYYLKRKEAKMKKEQEEIKRLQAELSSLKAAIGSRLGQLQKLFLAERAAAAVHNDMKFAEKHQEAAAILVEMQKMTEVQQ